MEYFCLCVEGDAGNYLYFYVFRYPSGYEESKMRDYLLKSLI